MAAYFAGACRVCASTWNARSLVAADADGHRSSALIALTGLWWAVERAVG